MHNKLLGIAIVALLPLTGAVAATPAPTSACETAVRNNYAQSSSLDAAMKKAVESGACTSNGQAANAGYKIAGNDIALRKIVGAFAANAGVGVNQAFFAKAGSLKVEFGNDGTGGSGGGTGELPYNQ